MPLPDLNSPMWIDLFLCEASAPYQSRTIPGCSYPPPLPRLVGIELNPGPPRPKVSVDVKVKTAMKTKAPRAKAEKRKKKRRGPPNKSNSVVQSFLTSALNPFQNAPPALGYELFQPPMLDTAWYRTFGETQATAVTAAVVFDPASTGPVSAASNAYVTLFQATSALSSLSASSTNGRNATNVARIITTAYEARPITAALRCTVRYPATSAPGRLFMLDLSIDYTTLITKTFNDLAALDCAHPISFDGSGVAMIQGNWRQMGSVDFNMTPTGVANLKDFVSSKVVFLAIGWPAGFLLDIEAISHLETTGGALAGSVAGDEVPTLALQTPIEVLATMVRAVPQILNKTSIAACERLQLNRAIGRHTISRVAGGTSAVPQGVAENDYVDISSSAGEFVTGLGTSIRDRLPSNYDLGAGVGSLLTAGALAHAGLRRNQLMGA